jgi:uncharacterized protein (DUF1499 family)
VLIDKNLLLQENILVVELLQCQEIIFLQNAAEARSQRELGKLDLGWNRRR